MKAGLQVDAENEQKHTQFKEGLQKIEAQAPRRAEDVIGTRFVKVFHVSFRCFWMKIMNIIENH